MSIELIPLHLFTGPRGGNEGTLDWIKIPDRKTDLSLCSTEYVLYNGRAVLVLFSRDERGEDYLIPVFNFEPYFYTTPEYARRIQSTYPGIARFDYPEIDYFSHRGKVVSQLTKVVVPKPSVVKSLKRVKTAPRSSKVIQTWEADILFPLRFLIDSGIKTGFTFDPDGWKITPKDMPSNFRKLYVDIETFSYKNPDMIKTMDQITVIGMYDSFVNKYIILTYPNPTGAKLPNAEFLSQFLIQDTPLQIIVCKSEIDMLNRFKSYVSMTKPDVFLSFTNFDWIYLIKRMKKLGMYINNLSRVDVAIIYESKKKDVIPHKIKIHGLQYLDIQDMYFQVFLSGSKWESLHGVATKELGEEKLFKEESVYDNWINFPERVLIRNLRDVEIIKRLDEELSLFAYFDTIRRNIGSNFADTVYKSRVADIMYLRFCNERLILPSKVPIQKVKYEGGIVFEVEPNIYKDIVIFDWSSMYPSIIKAFNMSFETYMEAHEEGVTYNIDDQYYFAKEPKGWTSELIDILLPIRAPYKKRAKDKSLSKTERNFNKAVSAGIKTVVNSIYGVFGLSGKSSVDEETGKTKRTNAYRLYIPFVASATTYVGRKLQEEGLAPICDEIGYEVIYADTDSIFVQLKGPDYEKEIEYLESEIAKRVNKFIINRWGVNPEGLELSFESHYETLVMFSKKRYIGRTITGDLITKGLEIVRRNTAEISGEVQMAVATAIFDRKSREDIIEICKDFVQSFRKKELEEIAVAQNLKKPWYEYATASAHVKAYCFSRAELGLDLVVNKRFWTAYIKHKEIPENYDNKIVWDKYKDEDGKDVFVHKKINMVGWDDRNPLPEDILEIIDYDKMLEKTIHDKIKLFLELLDIRWYEDILGVENPKKKKARLAAEKRAVKEAAKALRKAEREAKKEAKRLVKEAKKAKKKKKATSPSRTKTQGDTQELG